MSKKSIIQGVLTILAAAITAALSFFFTSCSASSHMEFKHSADSLVIRKDGQSSLTKVALPPSHSFYYVQF